MQELLVPQDLPELLDLQGLRVRRAHRGIKGLRAMSGPRVRPERRDLRAFKVSRVWQVPLEIRVQLGLRERLVSREPRERLEPRVPRVMAISLVRGTVEEHT